jgi:Chromo (CHRromatin Organisation MOdifier) domain
MRFGLPEKIISDRDLRFASHLYQELRRLLGVKLAMSTAYHPQTDGKTEWVSQELEVYLCMLCSNNPKTWKQFLHTTEFAHNQKTHSSMKSSPFYLMMGYHPWAIPTAYEKNNIPTTEQRIAQLLQAREEALAAHELARQLMASQINKKFKPFKAGDKVWLESKNLKISYPTRKLSPKWEGPFIIQEVLSKLSYWLKLPPQWTIQSVFHAVLLTPFKENETHGANFLTPPPDLIEGQEEYEVEVIITHKKHRWGYQYLVKWIGYPTSENTWEPEANLKNVKELLKAYKNKKQL